MYLLLAVYNSMSVFVTSLVVCLFWMSPFCASHFVKLFCNNLSVHSSKNMCVLLTNQLTDDYQPIVLLVIRSVLIRLELPNFTLTMLQGDQVHPL